MSRRARERANARPGSKASNQSQTTTSTLATSQGVTTMSSQIAAPTPMTCLETCMLTEAELAADLRISARFGVT